VISVLDAHACSRAFPTYTVKSDFLVRVTDRGKPLSGIEVEIRREIREPEFRFETALWNRTNDKGELLIHHLPVGTYLIETRHAEIGGEEAGELKVSDSPDALSELGLHWPAHAIFTLRQIQGLLAAERDPIHMFEKSTPLSGVSVLLIDAFSAQQIGAAVSDDHGDFGFPSSIGPGLYILRISERGLENKGQDTLIQGNIFVEVDANSAVNQLPKMNLMMTTCGLAAATDKDHLVNF
jgi:hypothetical protein